MIVRTMVAHCDSKTNCAAILHIPSDTTQPFLFLARHQWSSPADTEGIKTYCSIHRSEGDL